MSTDDSPALLAQTRAFNAELEAALAEAPAINTVPVELTRRARREGRGFFGPPVFVPRARTLEIEGPAGPIGLRIVAPERGAAGAFLHLHGGGWTVGANDMQDPRLARLADETGLTVVSVEYRLAPEHPYPAGPDDCEAAACWLVGAEGSEQIAGEGPLAIGGDSAGAHLAVLTLLRLRDRHSIADAFGAAVLQYGCFDMSMTPSARRWGSRNLLLSEPIMRWFADQFLPEHDLEQRRDPDISPLYADLSAMPAAIFTVGTLDPLLDDTLFMEARWRMAGAATELQVWADAAHGFLTFPIAAAERALAAEHDFLRRTLALDAGVAG